MGCVAMAGLVLVDAIAEGDVRLATNTVEKALRKYNRNDARLKEIVEYQVMLCHTFTLKDVSCLLASNHRNYNL